MWGVGRWAHDGGGGIHSIVEAPSICLDATHFACVPPVPPVPAPALASINAFKSTALHTPRSSLVLPPPTPTHPHRQGRTDTRAPLCCRWEPCLLFSCCYCCCWGFGPTQQRQHRLVDRSVGGRRLASLCSTGAKGKPDLSPPLIDKGPKTVDHFS